MGGDPLVTTTLLYGELRTGRITDTLAATSASWSIQLNDAGTVDQVTVPAAEVRAKQLRYGAAAGRTFLAVDVDGQIMEAGPIWSRAWDAKSQTLTLGAAGLWSYYDHRKILPYIPAGTAVQDVTTLLTGADLRSIACGLLTQSKTLVASGLPVIIPDATAGTLTEEFPGWSLPTLGDVLREFTQRDTAAPDIRFRPRYTSDRLGIEWVFEAGTADAPLLTQVGDDWVFDATTPRTPVLNIGTDEDATGMASQAWMTGNGTEAGTLIAGSYSGTLIAAGWPLLEVEEAQSSVEDQAVLQALARNLRDRSSRPIEVWNLEVQRAATVDVLPGHYAQVVPALDDPWLPQGPTRMRVKGKSGDLSDTVTLDMYSTTGRII
jgi:hypothetical protein